LNAFHRLVSQASGKRLSGLRHRNRLAHSDGQMRVNVQAQADNTRSWSCGR
jgi:hypothetical protein